MKLGKKAVRHDPRTLRLSRYALEDMTPPPTSVDWTRAAKLTPMFLNDALGDCTIATIAHLVDCWTSENGVEYIVSNADVLRAYQAVSGYDGSPESDVGAVVLDVLNYWRRVGVGGHKIDAYVALDLKNRLHFKQAIAYFGGAYLGFSLPASAPFEGDWHLALGGTEEDPTPGSLGGHAVPALAYVDEGGPGDGLTVRTWGGNKRLSWSFLDAYCDEAYAVVSPDWADADGTPSGFDRGQLLSDLARVEG